MVVLPRSAPWLAEFVAELVGFPNARHDDQADALAQMLAHPPLAPLVNAGPELVTLDDEGEHISDWGGFDGDPWGA